MMDCKGALAETQGDVEAAIDLLRKKGLAKAAKKGGRIAADGLIGVVSAPGRGAVVEVNSETDFVARGEIFQVFVKAVAKLALEVQGHYERLMGSPCAGASSAAEAVSNMIAKIGENISIRRSAYLAVDPGMVATYVHNAAAPDLGKIGVLVAMKSSGDSAKVAALGKQVAMHVAAASPLALSVDALPADVVARWRAIYTEQAKESGKPPNVVEKMVEGRMRKFYEESVLLNQIFVIDGETQVAKVLEKAAKDIGAPVEIAGFVRYQVGEGIDKPKGDFGDEVRAMAGGH